MRTIGMLGLFISETVQATLRQNLVHPALVKCVRTVDGFRMPHPSHALINMSKSN